MKALAQDASIVHRVYGTKRQAVAQFNPEERSTALIILPKGDVADVTVVLAVSPGFSRTRSNVG
jgi:hypothetical protein